MKCWRVWFGGTPYLYNGQSAAVLVNADTQEEAQREALRLTGRDPESRAITRTECLTLETKE